MQGCHPNNRETQRPNDSAPRNAPRTPCVAFPPLPKMARDQGYPKGCASADIVLPALLVIPQNRVLPVIWVVVNPLECATKPPNREHWGYEKGRRHSYPGNCKQSSKHITPTKNEREHGGSEGERAMPLFRTLECFLLPAQNYPSLPAIVITWIRARPVTRGKRGGLEGEDTKERESGHCLVGL